MPVPARSKTDPLTEIKPIAKTATGSTKSPVKSTSRGPDAAGISILGREFKVSVAEADRAKLLQSVEFTNRKMDEVRASGKVVGNERIAILAALNIAHELLHTPSLSANSEISGTSPDWVALNKRIEALTIMLDSAVAVEQSKLF
jgi:cell division protein ZapA